MSYSSYAPKQTSLSDWTKYQQAVSSPPEVAVPASQPVPDYIQFVPPANSTNETAMRMAKGLESGNLYSTIPGWYPSAPINTKSAGVITSPSTTSPVVTNFMMSFVTSGIDGTANAALILDKGVTTERATAVRQWVNSRYVGQGSAAALFVRIKKQTPAKPRKPHSNHILQRVLLTVPVAAGTNLSDANDVSQLDVLMNWNAHPGAPYFLGGVKLGDVADKEILRANQYLEILKKKGVTGLFKHFFDPSTSHRHYATAILAPKLDVYERSEYFTKTRPFYVFPGALRILFSCFTDMIKNHLTPFSKDPNAISAVGFSWAAGGATQITTWMNKKRSPGLKLLAWGDDHILQITAKDGSSFVLCPDVSGMDMKLQSPEFDLFRYWIVSQITGEHLTMGDLDDPTQQKKMAAYMTKHKNQLGIGWYRTIHFFTEYLARTPVLGPKQFCFDKTVGLPSGINFTTILDIIASATMEAVLQTLPPPDSSELGEVKRYLEAVVASMDDLGFPYKPDTMSYQTVRSAGGKRLAHPTLHTDPLGRHSSRKLHATERLALTFLGMSIGTFTFVPEYVRDGTPLSIEVPTMDPIRVMGLTVLCTAKGKGEERFPSIVSGLVGRGFLVTHDTMAFDYLANLYNLHISMGHYPSRQATIPVGMEDVDLEPGLKAAEYPSREWFAMVYAGTKEKTLLHDIKPPPSRGEARDENPPEQAALTLPERTFTELSLEEEVLPAAHASAAQSSSSSGAPKVRVLTEITPKEKKKQRPGVEPPTDSSSSLSVREVMMKAPTHIKNYLEIQQDELEEPALPVVEKPRPPVAAVDLRKASLAPPVPELRAKRSAKVRRLEALWASISNARSEYMRQVVLRRAAGLSGDDDDPAGYPDEEYEQYLEEELNMQIDEVARAEEENVQKVEAQIAREEEERRLALEEADISDESDAYETPDEVDEEVEYYDPMMPRHKQAGVHTLESVPTRL